MMPPRPTCPCGHNLLYQDSGEAEEKELSDGTHELTCLSCGKRLHEDKDGYMTVAEKT